MNLIYKIMLLGMLTTANAQSQPVEAPVIVEQAKTPQELVVVYAQKYGVSADLITCLISNENKEWDADAQSKIIYNFSDPKRGIVKGEQEKSYGLAMIHLPDHPLVTLEQATDPEFAIDFMARNVSEGRSSMWTVLKYCK